MDSKTVTHQIQSKVWPLLKSQGFSHFTSRTAWRFRARKIDVVNYQSFNSHLASSLGCTTYSFAINLGCYFNDIPDQFEPGVIKENKGNMLPQEYQCHFRRQLVKSIRQREFPRDDIWYIDSEGKYLTVAIDETIRTLQQKAFPWFEKYETTCVVFQELLQGTENSHKTYGFGANPSPLRSFMIGHIALVIGEQKLAQQHLRAALDSGLFKNNHASMNEALRHLSEAKVT